MEKKNPEGWFLLSSGERNRGGMCFVCSQVERREINIINNNKWHVVETIEGVNFVRILFFPRAEIELYSLIEVCLASCFQS